MQIFLSYAHQNFGQVITQFYRLLQKVFFISKLVSYYKRAPVRIWCLDRVKKLHLRIKIVYKISLKNIARFIFISKYNFLILSNFFFRSFHYTLQTKLNFRISKLSHLFVLDLLEHEYVPGLPTKNGKNL